MDILIYIGVSIALIIISFFIGRKTVLHYKQLNNDEILKQRSLIEKDLQDKQIMIARIEDEYQSKKQLMEDAQESAKKAYDEKIRALDIEYQQRNKELNNQHIKKSIELDNSYQDHIRMLEEERELVESELSSIKETRNAAIEAARKEREIKDQPNKYCISVSEDEKHDIEYLETIIPKLNFPEILGKYIWSVFFQKKMKFFMANILGPNEICGIYKITDQLTGESYIGQSVKIKQRWIEHIKCGIGAIPISNANQLYAAMKRDGIWNFSFELLEQCSKEELNEKERRFIDIYSADITGLNSKKGNK